MTEVATNYTISMTEVTTNFNEAEGFFQPTELEDAIKMSMKECDDQTLCMAGGGKNNQTPGVAGVPFPKPEPVDPTDPHVIEIAKFAVKNHKKQAGTNLVFLNVVSCFKWSVDADTYYAHIIHVRGHICFSIHNAKALVSETKTGHKTLIWFKG